jgi:hypothetical protein
MCVSSILAVALAALWAAPQSGSKPAPLGAIHVQAVPVPLNPLDPSMTSVGDFRYAGGISLLSRQTDLLHELSDLVITGADRLVAVGDEGVLFEGRLLLGQDGRLTGVTDGILTRLVGENNRPLTGANIDAEGLALLPNGDRLVSFERHPRIWLYPSSGAPPRAVPSPRESFRPNAGMEALTAVPDAGDDAYLVGAEDAGATWACRLATSCIKGPIVDKPAEFGLVSMHRLPDGLTAYLLRAYDSARGPRITLKIVRGATIVARLDMAAPLTVDNFEGVASVPGANGLRRFYLISDDNDSPTQRTLLLAFDWEAKPGPP